MTETRSRCFICGRHSRNKERKGHPACGRQNRQGLNVLKLSVVRPSEQNDSALLGLPLSEWHKKFAHVNRKGDQRAVIGLEITKQYDEECIDCAMCQWVRVSAPR